MTEIIVIMDRSGSMSTIRGDAVGGFNTFIEEQKKLDGEANVTLAIFDHDYEVIHDCVDVQEVPELTGENFKPRGMTALYDAIGRTIDDVGKRLDKANEKPDGVIVAILTDGEENDSREYDHARVTEMITHQTEKYSWEFVFLAANQDALKVGGAMGIGTNVNFEATGVGTRAAYATMSTAVSSYRQAVAQETVEED